MAHFEKQLTTKTVYDGKILALHTDQVELENGNDALREVVVHHGGVGILPVDAENNLIALKGAIPGPKGGIVYLTDSVKKA